MRITNSQVLAALAENAQIEVETPNVCSKTLLDSEDLQERIEMLAVSVAHHMTQEIVLREIHGLIPVERARELRRDTMIALLDMVNTFVIEELRTDLRCRTGIDISESMIPELTAIQ